MQYQEGEVPPGFCRRVWLAYLNDFIIGRKQKPSTQGQALCLVPMVRRGQGTSAVGTTRGPQLWEQSGDRNLQLGYSRFHQVSKQHIIIIP